MRKDLVYTIALFTAFGFAMTALVLGFAAVADLLPAAPTVSRGRLGLHTTHVGSFVVVSGLLVGLVWLGGGVVTALEKISGLLKWKPATSIPTLLALPCMVAGAYLAFAAFGVV